MINENTLSNSQYNATPPVVPDGSFVPDQSDVHGNKKITLATVINDVNDTITTYPKCSYLNLAASALLKIGSGQAYGVIINSHTGGTLKLWDNTSAATTVICNTITFSAVATTGERFIPLYGATFGTGLYATIGGTADITILYR